MLLVASNSLFYRKIFRLLPKEPNPRLPRVNFRQEMQWFLWSSRTAYSGKDEVFIKPEEFALYSLMMTIHMGRHKGGFKRRIPMCVWTMVTSYCDSEHVRLPKRRTRLSFICKINTVTTTIRVRNAPSPTNGKRSKSPFSTISVWGVAWPMYKLGHTTIRGW